MLSCYQQVEGQTHSVAQVLERYRGGKAYIATYPGNNGDTLIRLGMAEQLRSAGIKPCAFKRSCDVVIIPGGGSMNKYWGNAFANLTHHINDSLQRPIVVLPNSYYFKSDQDLGDVLANCRVECHLFARDHYSLASIQRVAKPDNVHYQLDHDCAFAVDGSPWLAQFIKARQDHGYVLLVERRDLESPYAGLTPERPAPKAYPSWMRMAYEPIKKRRIALRQKRWKKERQFEPIEASQPFEQTANEALASYMPKLAQAPRIVGDVSSPNQYSLDDFTSLIANASCVITNRLHAGVFSAFIGVPTVLVAAQHKKIEGVFELSMTGRPDVYMHEAIHHPADQEADAA